MREKIIFEGRLDARASEIDIIVGQFYFDNFISPLDSSPEWKIVTEPNGNMRALVILQPEDRGGEKIYNGYVEISPVSYFESQQVFVRIVSCRPELDLLYFQLSQKIQARFIIPGFPPDVLTTPWRKLMEEGLINPNRTSLEDLTDEIPDPDDVVKRYGSNHNLTKNDVKRYVMRCRHFMERGELWKNITTDWTILTSDSKHYDLG